MPEVSEMVWNDFFSHFSLNADGSRSYDGVQVKRNAVFADAKGHWAQDAIEKLLPNIEFETCETTMLPNEYVTLTDPEEIEAFHKLMDMLNEADDVNKVYHNAIINE